MSVLYVAGVSLTENPQDTPQTTLDIIKICEVAVGEERKPSLRLLKAAGAPEKKLYLINEHSGSLEREAALKAVLKAEKSVFFSDAGTPCISDPDWRFVSMCREKGAKITSLPGPSSVTAAISVAGMDCSRFFFAGFPPREPALRRRFFENVASARVATVIMERPYALETLLKDILFINRKISLSLNLGCKEEQNYFEVPVYLAEKLKGVKAPFIIVVPPKPGKSHK